MSAGTWLSYRSGSGMFNMKQYPLLIFHKKNVCNKTSQYNHLKLSSTPLINYVHHVTPKAHIYGIGYYKTCMQRKEFYLLEIKVEIVSTL